MRPARIAAVFVAALVLAPPALALPPGVFVAPGSPAGREYSFPLSVLRGEAGGHDAHRSTQPPLFGVGVNPGAPEGTAAEHGGSNSGAAQPYHPARGTSRATTDAAPRMNPRQQRVDTQLASLVRPSSDVPQIVLIAVVLLVVAVAFGAGIAVARRRS